MGFISPAELSTSINAIQATQNITANPADPGAITSSTSAFVMAGCGVILAPALAVRTKIFVAGLLASSAAGDGGIAQIAWGSGTPPAKSAAFAGQLVGTQATLAAIGTTPTFFCLRGFTPGVLKVGVPYWFDVAVQAVTGGNVTLTKLWFTIEEF